MAALLSRLVPFAALCVVVLTAEISEAADAQQDFSNRIAQIEAEFGGRFGVAVHDLLDGPILAYKADQRFSMSSTFKALLCGMVLSRVDVGHEALDRVISFTPDQIVAYSPVTETHLDTGMSVAALCEATVTISDNTAANLLLESVGGPDRFTQYVRTLGDQKTRLDRWETELNEAAPGDDRDTTTPDAILKSLRVLAFGDALSPASQQQFRQWMIDDKVADALLRSVLPDGWAIGDKTGAGGHGARGIIAIVWPTDTAPVLVAIYLAENGRSMDDRNRAIARIGTVIFDLLWQR